MKMNKKRYILISRKKSGMNYNSIMIESQKIKKLLESTPNQPSKFRTKNWTEVNNESRWTYNVNSQIKFKTGQVYVIIVMHICTFHCKYNSPKHSSSWSSSKQQKKI